MTEFLLIVGFGLVSLASERIGRLVTRVRLPLITGYLVTGAVVGPFVLGWMTNDAVRSLRLVDHASLAFIAFAAGGELYLKELRSCMRSITLNTAAQLICTFTLGTLAVMGAAERIPFMADLSFNSRLAVAFMAAAILVARSPSSAIAIISELRARGPFSKTAIGVTMVMDALVIVLFATAATVSHSLVSGGSLNPSFLLNVSLDLLASVAMGVFVAWAMRQALSGNGPLLFKSAMLTALGLGVFWLSPTLRDATGDQLGWAVTLEPLLTCMVAGFWVANVGDHRDDFSAVLDEVAPYIYIVFFTLVGASLALDTLVRLWPVALVLFGARLAGIVGGSLLGGMLAGDPPQHTRLSWMAYITQAGVGLGLAKDVAAEFPVFGAEFATMVIAVIVLNQIVGPPAFKFAIKRVGEARLRGQAKPDEVRDAVILGIDDQAYAVADLLQAHDWEVTVVDLDGTQQFRSPNDSFNELYFREIDEWALSTMVTPSTDAVIAMMGDDEENFRICEICYETFGVRRIVVRLNDLSWSDSFAELGALVVEPASAMVNLVDQLVRVPRLANMLLHRDPEQEVIQITIADPDIDGVPLRELRLPPGVRVLGVSRRGHAVVPQGNTILRLNDEVTLVGDEDNLTLVATRWGY